MDQIDRHTTYDGVDAHIKIPESPKGLVFIAPGAAVSTQSSLIITVQDAFEERGLASVVADIGQSGIIMDDPKNVHGNFADNLQRVINGYYQDQENDYTPDQFELAGHSMGGAAVLTLAPDASVSAVTVFDPTPVSEEQLAQIEAPVTIMVCQVRSFKAAGHIAFKRLGGEENGHTIHEMNTSTERQSGHMFEGAEKDITDVIINNGSDGIPAPDPDDINGLDM